MSPPALRRVRLPPRAQGALFYFGYYTAYAVYMPFLTVFYAHKGLSGTEIGLLSAVGPLVALLAGPGLTALADRRGWQRRLLGLALTGTALCVLAIPFPGSFAGLLPVVVLYGLCFCPIISLADGLIASLAARHRLAYGSMRLWGSLGWAITAAAGGALWQQIGFTLMFPLAGLLFLATLVIAQLLPDERALTQQTRHSLRKVLADRRFATVLVCTFAVGLCLQLGATFAAVYMDRLSGQLLVGLFSGVAALAELPTMFWSERVAGRLGGPRTLLLAYALLALAYLGLIVTREPQLLMAVAVLRGFGYGLFVPTTVRLVAGWAPAGRAATYQGLLNAGLLGLAPLVANPFGGMLYDAAGPQAVFLACVGAVGLAALVMFLAQVGGVFRRTGESPDEANRALAAGPAE